MKKETSKKIMAMYCIFAAILFIVFLIWFFKSVDISTEEERAERFCEANGMIYDRQVLRSCVSIVNSTISERRYITYVEGIKDWRWLE